MGTSNRSTRSIGRDAITGRFKPVDQARRDSSTSTVEKIPAKPAKSPNPKKR
jgi:hypothetical protein